MTDADQQQPAFALEKIYLKDVSYEAPNVPHVFLEKTPPEVMVQLGIEPAVLSQEDGVYEVALAVTVTGKVQDKTVFLVEAKQAGVFRIAGIPEPQVQKVLEITCPTILLPFVREVINDLVNKGGFPQLLINPINFETLYEQKHAAQTQPH